MVERIKKKWADQQVIAGEHSDAEAARALVDVGADAIKVVSVLARSAPLESWPVWVCPKSPRSPMSLKRCAIPMFPSFPTAVFVSPVTLPRRWWPARMPS